MDRVEFSLGSLIVNDDTSPKLSSFTHQNPLALPNHNGGSKIVWSKMTTSTLNTIYATDLGAIPNNSISNNYTNEQYRINEWYNLWLPDPTRRHDSKTTYTVQITHNNHTNETFVWHGPPAPSDPPGPVKWFRPYYDCKRSNKWIYGASVPVPDIYPRHTGWRHIEIPM